MHKKCKKNRGMGTLSKVERNNKRIPYSNLAKVQRLIKTIQSTNFAFRKRHYTEWN